MRITDALRDRAQLSRLLDPASSAFVEGSDEDRARARAEWHRHQYIGQVMRSNLDEIPRSDLTFRRFGLIEASDGRLYRARRDAAADIGFEGAVAYYIDQTGYPHLLEEPPGAKTRQELEQQQAAREQQRNQPKPRPAWMQR